MTSSPPLWTGPVVNPESLSDIDGLSLAGLMQGEEADEAFSKRYLYFHYPHYRSGMPTSAIVSGKKKVMHFYEAPDIPMLFDLWVTMKEKCKTLLIKSRKCTRNYLMK